MAGKQKCQYHETDEYEEPAVKIKPKKKNVPSTFSPRVHSLSILYFISCQRNHSLCIAQCASEISRLQMVARMIAKSIARILAL